MTDSQPARPAVTNLRELEEWIDREGIRFFKIGVFDVDGVLRGKYVDRAKLRSAVDQGFGFCDVVLGWDMHDALYDRVEVSGWHTGYRDAPVRLDLGSLRRIPFEEDTLLLIGSFAGDYAEVCPRTILARTIEKAADMGFGVDAAFEYEFFLFDETPHSVREKGYRDLQPVTPGMFGYSVLRNSVHAEFHHDLMDLMEEFDCALEGLHTETGPGVLEAAIRYTRGLDAADRAAIFKTFTKVFAQRADLMATFMAKWSNDYPGQSGHLHLSLADRASGENAFHSEGAPSSMSETMQHFVAGQVRYLPELLAMVCSTINSYRRLVPGMWAPTSANWGDRESHDCDPRDSGRPEGPAQRVPDRARRREPLSRPGRRPRLRTARNRGASRASGRDRGQRLRRPEGAGPPRCPPRLREASQALRASTMARECFGDAFVDHFCATRDWEDQQFRKAVTDWDLSRYFEII